MVSLKEYIKTLFNSFLNNTNTRKYIAVQGLTNGGVFSQQTLPQTETSVASDFTSVVAPCDGYISVSWMGSNNNNFRLLQNMVTGSMGVGGAVGTGGVANLWRLLPCKKGLTYYISTNKRLGTCSSIVVYWIKSIGGES